METPSFLSMCLSVVSVLTVPMRNGNPHCSGYFLSRYHVLTVPMRNGNAQIHISLLRQTLVLTVPMRNGNLLSWTIQGWSIRVLTVPMRNGNTALAIKFNKSREFLPYLWGMETLIDRHYIERSCVLTVPMRNGNQEFCNCRVWRCWMFLPYLWGMETSIARKVNEKWALSSYRTYEEWKLPNLFNNISFNKVLTVPMRNGNCSI